MYGNVNYFNVICTIIQERGEISLLHFILYALLLLLIGTAWQYFCLQILRKYRSDLGENKIAFISIVSGTALLFLIVLGLVG